jgi:hypothetical protein
MTNAAAIGYALMAANASLKISGDKLVQLEYAIKAAMDQYTEEEAEEFYRKN